MRRFLLVLLVLTALFAVALITVPWWFGPALAMSGQRFGLTFERYERVGYERFRLHRARVTGKSWVVTVDTAEFPHALTWAWARLHGRTAQASADGWEVSVTPQPAPADADRVPSGWVPLHRKLFERVYPIVNRLPEVEARDGSVQWPGHQIRIDHAVWKDGRLDASGNIDGRLPLSARISPHLADRRFDLAATAPIQEVSAQIAWRAEDATAELSYLGNRAEAASRFAPEGWWPATSHVQGAQWKIPADRLRLGTAYRSMDGHFVVDWNAADFIATTEFTAAPAAASAPPLAVRARATGDAGRGRIEELGVTLPGINARLTAPVVFTRAGGLDVSGDSRFELDGDLARQPWFEASGTVRGQVTLTRSVDAPWRADFILAGDRVSWSGLNAPTLRVGGNLKWPMLEVSTARVDLGESSRLEGAATVDLRESTIRSANTRVSLDGQLLRRWLPPALQVGSISGEASFSGPLRAPRHEGEARVSGLAWNSLRDVEANVSWHGDGRTIADAEVEAHRGELRVAAAGSGSAAEIAVREFQLAHGGEALWRLDRPALVKLAGELAIKDLALSGPAGIIVASADRDTGRLQANLRDPALDWIKEVFPAMPPWPVQVHTLDFAANWSGSADAELQVGLDADYPLRNGHVIQAALRARSRDHGLAIEEFRFADGARVFARAQGTLPVAVRFAPVPQARLVAGVEMDVQAATEPYPEFWERFAEITGVRVENPVGRLQLRGTLESPRGMIDVTADSASVDEKKSGLAWPAVEKLVLHGSAVNDALQLNDLSFQVDGQEARISGRLPMTGERWRQLAQAPATLDWREGDLKLQIEHARLAPFARYLPRFLAPQGYLTANFALKPGGLLGGRLEISGAATRPIGSLGAVQDVAAEIEFRDRRADFRRLTAAIGGEPLALEGWVELPEQGDPRLNVRLRGKNIPVARQPGLVVRSDLDLQAQTPPTGPTRLSGTLRLRDSLYVANLRSLIPGDKQAGPRRAPPYFSVEPAPLNAWQLDVAVVGERFLRVRMPLFRGLISARFKLGGTLGDPIALGEARINEGTALFPFAGFNVDEGTVELTADRPKEPQLRINGTSLRYGYDLRMELTGTASRPNLVFSSRPTLTSEQILLLVMAGEPPTQNNIATSTDPQGQQRYAQLGAYLGRNLFTTFGGDPSAADRLTITTGERLSRQGQETLSVEYDLGRQWALVGEYDEYDDYNVGLKWKVLRRKEATADEDH